MFILQCEARRILVELLPRKAGRGRKRTCRALSLARLAIIRRALW
jgi:hypothetical protein